jgi:hypothetical protein
MCQGIKEIENMNHPKSRIETLGVNDHHLGEKHVVHQNGKLIEEIGNDTLDLHI